MGGKNLNTFHNQIKFYIVKKPAKVTKRKTHSTHKNMCYYILCVKSCTYIRKCIQFKSSTRYELNGNKHLVFFVQFKMHTHTQNKQTSTNYHLNIH